MDDCIDINPSVIDMPFFLPSPNPIDISTANKEGLSSYILRTCHFNHIRPSQVFGWLTKNIPDAYGLIYPSFWTDINGSYGKAIHLVQCLIRRNLVPLTAIPIMKFFGDRKILRKHQAWCPECYYQWKRQGNTLYQPLIWSFSNIKYCTLHGTMLIERCPNCEAILPNIPNNTNIGYCPKCSEWLGANNNDDKMIHNDFFKFQKWITFNIESLITNDDKLSNWEVFESNAHWLMSKDSMYANTFKSWTEVRPKFSSLLFYSYKTQIPIFDMLIKDLRHDEIKLPNYKDTQRIVHKLNYADMEKALHEIIDSNEEPFPNLNEVACRLHCSTHPLVTRWPELCKVIRAKHRLYLAKAHNQKIEAMVKRAAENSTLRRPHKDECNQTPA